MARASYMPLYVADYLADAAHLTAQEHGAYLLLIMNYWQRGKPLPDNDRVLAGVARVSADEWPHVREVLEPFFLIEGGQWLHKRIDAELASSNARLDAASKAGKASAERRAKGGSTPVERPLNEGSTNIRKDKKDIGSNEPINEIGKRAKPKRALPDDWTPSETDAAFARSRGMSDAEIADEAEKVRNWALANPDKARKADWAAFWRSWVMNRRPLPSTRSPPEPRGRAANIAVIDEVFDRMQGRQ